jgi:hypothetical protein
MGSPRIAGIRKICALFLVAQILKTCRSDRKLNLNEWLLEFENCHVNIVALKDLALEDIDYGIFHYPILQSNNFYNEILDKKVVEYNSLRKRNFCAVFTFVISRFSKAASAFIFQKLIRLHFCSKPPHGNTNDDDANTFQQYRYRWTSCIFVFVLPEIKTGTLDQDLRDEILNVYQRNNRRDVQTFIFSFNEMGYKSLQISKVEYVCQQCIGSRPTVWEIQCPLPTCRKQMEVMAAGKMEDGRNIVSLLTSEAPPYERYLDASPSIMTLFKMRPYGLTLPLITESIKLRLGKLGCILILPQHNASTGLLDMSLREYYFRYRDKINFIRMNQALLFEGVSKNTSKYFTFSNSGISDFNPSLNSAPFAEDPSGYFEFGVNSNFMLFTNGMPQLYYTTVPHSAEGGTASVYATSDTAFNFLTCHGFHKPNRISVYLAPFDWKIWIFILSATFCLIIIMAMTYCCWMSLRGHRTTISAYIVNSTCYIISVLLENGYGNLHIPHHGRHVGNWVFLILAFLSVILGSLYKAIITTDMISPIIGSIPYENFSQLQNFTLVVIPSADMRVQRKSSDGKVSATRQVELGLLEKGVNLFASSDFTKYWRNIELMNENVSENFRYRHSSVTINTRVFEHEEDALAKLATCNKVAFVGSTEEIQDFDKFNQDRIKLGRGKVKFLSHNFYLIIPGWAGGFLQRRMAGLLSSGIWHIWAKVFYAKTRDELEHGLKKTIEIKQGLDTNLGALFQIYAFAVAFAIAVFTVEILYRLFRKCMHDCYPVA